MRFLSSSSLRFSLVMPCFPKLPWSLVPMNWKPSLIEGFGSNQFREAGNGRVPVKRFFGLVTTSGRPLHQVETRIRKVRTQNVPRKKKDKNQILELCKCMAWRLEALHGGSTWCFQPNQGSQLPRIGDPLTNSVQILWNLRVSLRPSIAYINAGCLAVNHDKM